MSLEKTPHTLTHVVNDYENLTVVLLRRFPWIPGLEPMTDSTAMY